MSRDWTKRDDESYESYAYRVAEGFIGVNEQVMLETMIGELARRHGYDLRNDEFTRTKNAPCGENPICDGAIIAAIASKMLWLMQVRSRQ